MKIKNGFELSSVIFSSVIVLAAKADKMEIIMVDNKVEEE